MGCENPSQVPVWEIEELQFYTCPMKIFHNSNVNDFYRELNMLQLGYIQPDKYNEKQARWYDAVTIYNSYYNRFVEMNRKKPTK